MLIQSPDRVLLKNISWQTYQSLLKDFEQQPGMRLTYDRGLLEIMRSLMQLQMDENAITVRASPIGSSVPLQYVKQAKREETCALRSLEQDWQG